MNKQAYELGESLCIQSVFGQEQEKVASAESFLSKLHPRELKALLASHPNLGVRAGEAGIGAGLGAGAGYASGDEGGMFSDDTRLRNALMGAAGGAGAGIGASALSRNLMNKGLLRGMAKETAGLHPFEMPLGQEGALSGAADEEALHSAINKLQQHQQEMQGSMFGLEGKKRLGELKGRFGKKGPKAPGSTPTGINPDEEEWLREEAARNRQPDVGEYTGE
jgi:hypothetical protein